MTIVDSVRRQRCSELLRKIAESEALDSGSYFELNKLFGKEQVDPEIGEALNEATELYVDWEHSNKNDLSRFVARTAGRRERLRQFAERIIHEPKQT